MVIPAALPLIKNQGILIALLPRITIYRDEHEVTKLVNSLFSNLLRGFGTHNGIWDMLDKDVLMCY